MKCLRIYARPDGESHLGEVEIPTVKRAIFPDAAPFELSAHYPASRIRFTASRPACAASPGTGCRSRC